jgi:hypothetical protein
VFKVPGPDNTLFVVQEYTIAVTKEAPVQAVGDSKEAIAVRQDAADGTSTF